MAFPTGYSKYQEVTIDHTKVSADLTDYIVYVNLADLVKAGADIFDTCRSDGGDIRATKSDGTTQLATELVAIDTTAKTGELHIKFAGTLSSSVDTIIRIYYNGTDTALATTDTYGRNAVWSDYSGVWHLNDTNWTDSTGSGNDLSPSSGAPTIVNGKLGKGADFIQANADYLTGSPVSTSGAKTWSIWGYHHVIDGDDILMGQGNAGSAPYAYASSGVTINTWNLFHGRFNGTNTVSIYKDGTDVTTTQNTTGGNTYGFSLRDNASVGFVADVSANTAAVFALGARANSLSTLNFDGVLDEARVRSSLLSGSWITTEHNNQSSPSTFYASGAEQGGTTSVTVNPVAQSITASIPAYSVKKGVTQSPAAQALTASIPAYTVRLPKTVSVSPQSIVASIPAYTVDAGGNISVAVAAQSLTLSVPAYAILLDTVFSPSPQTLTLSTPAASISLGTGVTVSPEAQTATLSIATPIITAQRSIIISVATQILTLSLPTLAKVGGVWTKRPRQTDADWGARARQTDADWSRREANDT